MKAKNKQNAALTGNCPSCGWTLASEDENCQKCDSALTAHIVFDKHGRIAFAILVAAFWLIALVAHLMGYACVSNLKQLTLIVEAGLWGLFFVFIPGADTCSECGRLLKWIVPSKCRDCKRPFSRKDRSIHRLMRIAFITTTIGITINTFFFFIASLN